MITDKGFFRQDATELAPALIGKLLARRMPDGSVIRLRITETEAYCGVDDTACHAHRGKTKRNELLWREGGTVYVYLCYGIHWLMNIISGKEDDPQGVLIRCCESAEGPGRLTRALGIDGSFNGLDITDCAGLWLEDDGLQVNITCDKRVGIAYADECDRDRPWRYIMK